MVKTTNTKAGKSVATYQISVIKKDLNEVVMDILKTFPAGKKVVITVN